MELHRDEEQSINRLILSGRVVSKVFYKKYYEKSRSDKKLVYSSVFVLKTENGNGDSSVFKIESTDTIVYNKLQKKVTKGCRLVIECMLESRRRLSKDLQRGLNKYTIHIMAKSIVNIFDTIAEYRNKEFYMLKQGKVVSDMNNGEFPTIDQFENSE